ncbi:MAG: CocE/NonD family hydrolase [Chitinophagales bacterium]|nr:CocE/NonD family hydrolase [Chitinophagales bacterium]MCO5281089.1 CocE/NonD family hydrolase [Chitinophagales bacterium]
MHTRYIFLFLFTFFSLVCNAGTHLDNHVVGGKNNGKLSYPGVYQGYTTPEYKGFKYHSLYLTMRDSTLIATDVYLPKKLEEGKQVPTILYLTRYLRSLRIKFPLNLFKSPILVVVPEAEIEFFTSHGYACIIADVRGSGASTGVRKMEFSPEEIADGKEIVDWIINQPWSNGKVGSTGVSYVGTTAEMLLANQHPAVKACIPRSNIFDLYNYVMMPGGIRQTPFIDAWGKTTQNLDHNNFSIFGKMAKHLLFGANPVQGDRGKKIYKSALAQHRNNFDITDGIKHVVFRDDTLPKLGLSSEAFSVHSFRKQIENSGTPIYRIGGWYDGALQKSLFDGMANTKNTVKVLVGPWDHGPQNNVSPFAATKVVNFPVKLEMLRFFDFYLKDIDNGIDKEPKLYYYTIGEETWKASNEWPIAKQEHTLFYLNIDSTLTPNIKKNGIVNYAVNYSASSGNTSRWNSITQLFMNGPTNYSNRMEEDKKLISFTTSPLQNIAEITGSPFLDIYWSADASDANVFAYLEDVSPDGTVTYITEGMFRPMHRKISENKLYETSTPFHSYLKEDAIPYQTNEMVRLQFEMLPTSYQLNKGHSIRVSFAGADAGHFDITTPRPKCFNFGCGTLYPSAISLPLSIK